MFFTKEESEENREFNTVLSSWQTLSKKSKEKEERKKKRMFSLLTREQYPYRDKTSKMIPLIFTDKKSKMIIAMGYSNEHSISHIDGDKLNNNVDNLKRVTKSYLYVLFNNHIIYKYYDVPMSVIGALFREKKSLGGLFDHEVKKGGYRFEKVSPGLYKHLTQEL